jgi:lipoprotein-releasing system permease protein
VQELVPAVVRAGIVKQGETVHGVLVKGVPEMPDQVGHDALSVSIPRRLSEITGLGAGDAITIYFVGEKVRVRKFTVSEVHQDLLELDDNLLVYARLEDLQRLNGWAEDQVSCLDIRVNPDMPREQVERLALGVSTLLLESSHPEEEDLLVSTASASYPQVFDWLTLLDLNVLIILVLMTLVAGFNMVSGLLVMLLRNVSTIGTLKTLGMNNGAIGRLFVTIGAKAVLKGMLVGNALALLFCWMQDTWHLIPLDPAHYFVCWVPVHVNVLWMLVADAIAFLGILALLWLPSRVIARIDPAATVKAD